QVGDVLVDLGHSGLQLVELLLLARVHGAALLGRLLGQRLHLVGLGLAGRLKIGDLLRVVAHLFPSQWEWRRLTAMRSAASRQSVSRHPFHGMPCAVRSTGRAE